MNKLEHHLPAPLQTCRPSRYQEESHAAPVQAFANQPPDQRERLRERDSYIVNAKGDVVDLPASFK